MDHLTLLEILGLERAALEEIVLLKLMNTQIATVFRRLNFSTVSSPPDLNEVKCSCGCDGLGPVQRRSI
jgi:hypothetical protein